MLRQLYVKVSDKADAGDFDTSEAQIWKSTPFPFGVAWAQNV